MSALARRNGWRGFDNIAEKVDGGWLYRCDGMPSMMGCGAEVVITRKFARVGVKSTGWLVCCGREFGDDPGDDGKGNDLDVVLTFCPSCRAVVESQDKGVTP
jgi:hypothetical protein